MTAALLITGVLVCLALRVPVAVALMVPSLIAIAADPDASVAVAVQQLTSGVNSSPLLAVPLFIMAGYAASISGIAERLVSFAQDLLAPVRGGLGYVTIGTGLVFSWMSGSATADAAGMGSVLSSPLQRREYDSGFAAGLIGASASIGAVMPPSIAAIVYAVTAGVSIGALFVAGVVPALLIVIALVVSVFLWARRHQPPRSSLPPGRQLVQKGLTVLPVLGPPVIVLGGILGGIFTPTEAAAIAVAYILLLGFCYRELSLRSVQVLLTRSASTAAQVMFIVAGASLFGWILTVEQIPAALAEGIAGLTDSPLVFLLLVNLVLLVIGMFLEATAALLIMVPVLLPTAVELGVDPLHLGAVMVLNLTIGLLTPPVGMILYVLASVTKAPIATVTRGSARFLIPLCAVLLVLTFVPAIALTLPNLLGFG